MGVKNPRKYTEEFKRDAMELAASLGSMKQAGEKLGIPSGTIATWLRKSGRKAVPLVANQESPHEEIRRLRKEVSDLKKANHILKAAAAFFSQDHLK